MLFNSYIFVLLFLPIVLMGWWGLRLSRSQRLITLVVASYIFYGYWDWRFTSLLALSTLIDYSAGAWIARSRSARTRTGLLIASVATNLGLLGFFKYSGFFARSWNAIADWIHLGSPLSIPGILLPIGISFYTFQTMSYTIDLYRGRVQPARDLIHFALYVSLFPQLVAGPIVRYAELEEQLRKIPERIDWQQFAQGIWFFAAGLVQKVLLADVIAARITPGLTDYTSLGLWGSWFCMLGYSCQLYFDFAGYSNMAVGLGWVLGFRFPQNFDSPYRAENISQFWRRWHMTLSSWLRDYLFIPLGGSHQGVWRTARNLLIVMCLGGLWHGAAWTFVLWGLYHGVLLAVHAAWRSLPLRRLPKPLGVLITFVAVVFGWVLFRSTDLSMSGYMAAAMLGQQGCEANPLAACGGCVSLLILVVHLTVMFGAPNVWQIRFRPTPVAAVVCGVGLALCILRFDSESPFLYFQF